MRKATLLAVTAGAISSLLVGVAMASSARTNTGATVKTRSTSLGKIIVNAQSKTLYLFMKDKNGRSSCYSQCASYWPPLMKKGTLRAGTGVKANLLGTTTRKNGKRQVTYNHHPLYLYSADTGAGQVSGQGLSFFGGKWYVVSAAGRAIKAAPPGGGGTTGTGTTGDTTCTVYVCP